MIQTKYEAQMQTKDYENEILTSTIPTIIYHYRIEVRSYLQKSVYENRDISEDAITCIYLFIV